MPRANRRDRGGFSLLEVLVAMTIFFGALAVIGQLAAQGMRMAQRTRLLAEAQLACESKLAEALVGLEPVDGPAGELKPLGQPAGWRYSLERIETPAGLAGVRVRVRQDVAEDRKAVEVELVRWLPESASPRPSADAAPGSAAP